MDMIKLIAQLREQYDKEHSSKSALNLKPVVKTDIFGNIIKEVGTLDQVLEQDKKEQYQKEKDIWVFKEVWKQLGDSNFQNIVAALGNPGEFKPCDGLTGQCSIFCDDYGHCELLGKDSPKNLEQELAAVQQNIAEEEQPTENPEVEGPQLAEAPSLPAAVSLTGTEKPVKKKRKSRKKK